jgi:hypothetical protein
MTDSAKETGASGDAGFHSTVGDTAYQSSGGKYQDGGRAAQNGEPLPKRSAAANRSCRSAGNRSR